MNRVAEKYICDPKLKTFASLDKDEAIMMTSKTQTSRHLLLKGQVAAQTRQATFFEYLVGHEAGAARVEKRRLNLSHSSQREIQA